MPRREDVGASNWLGWLLRLIAFVFVIFRLLIEDHAGLVGVRRRKLTLVPGWHRGHALPLSPRARERQGWHSKVGHVVSLK